MTTQTEPKPKLNQYLDIAGKIGQKQQQKFVTVEENGSKVAKRIVEFSIGSTIDGEPSGLMLAPGKTSVLRFTSSLPPRNQSTVGVISNSKLDRQGNWRSQIPRSLCPHHYLLARQKVTSPCGSKFFASIQRSKIKISHRLKLAQPRF